MNDFSGLIQHLEKMSQQAANLDRRRGEHHQPLFDERLFHCRARLLLPCVEEAKATYQSIEREQASGRLTATRAEYLSEQLLAQMAAIQREISTVTVRSNEIKHSSHFRKPINQLYQELAQHNEWERRLKEMVLEKQRELDKAPAFLQQEAQKALMTTEQRLLRCQQAKHKLENQITYRERNQ